MQSIYNYTPQRKHIFRVTYSFVVFCIYKSMPHVLLLLLTLLLLFVISFMQSIYNYTPQRKHIFRVTYSFVVFCIYK